MSLVTCFESIALDTRYGLRQLLKAPIVTLAVVLSLAVGIGANTAVFGLLDAAILKPLPVPEPDRLAVIDWTNADGFPAFVSSISGSPADAPNGGVGASSISAPAYRALVREQTGFEAIVGISMPDEVAASVGTAPAQTVDLQYVSANFFQGLNVSPLLGRAFRPEEDDAGESAAVVVSHRFWTSRLGGSTDALGRSIRVNDVTVRVVGVAPPGFFGLRAGQWTDLYAPLAARSTLERTPGSADPEDATYWWVRPVGRLMPDGSQSGAMAQLNSLFAREVAAIAGPDSDSSSIPELRASPGARGFDALDEQSRTALWLLMVLVGLLLIVCANVANLLLSRSEARQSESALRLALGARPARLFRQQSIECAMLALVGGAAGLTIGVVLANAIHDLFHSGGSASSAFALQMDIRVIGYTTTLSMVAALLFGLSPVFRASRARLGPTLVASSRSIAGGRLRGPGMLVSAQFALCLGALVAAGLLGGTLQRLTQIDLGFEPNNLVYATVNPWLNGYSAERVESYTRDVQRRLEELPGVTAVSRLQVRPLEGGGNFAPANISGRSPRTNTSGPDPASFTMSNYVGPGIFETLGIPIQAGRAPTRLDGDGVVVDERFAERFFDGQDALGRRFGIGAPSNDDNYEIVGIARDTVSWRLRGESLPTVYVPDAAVQSTVQSTDAIHFAVRTALDPEQLLESIRTAVSSVDESVPVTQMRTQAELLDRLLRTERLLAFLSAGFSLIAILLAGIGLAGLLAYSVARRTNEIGLRMALGAGPDRVVRMVMRASMRMVVPGLVIGIPLAYAIAKLLESSLYELAPSDPATMAASVLVLLAISIVASLLPARRAANTAPMAALREE